MNAELVNNLGNLANRTLSLLAGADLAKTLSPAGTGPGRKLVEDALARVKEVREAFERFDYRVAMKVILEIGHSANTFLTVHEPWKSKKTDREGARAALSDAADVAYLIAALIEPVVPRLAENLFRQLNAPKLSFAALEKAGYPLLDRGRPIGDPSPLINRMEESRVAQLIKPEAAAQVAAPVEPKKTAAPAAPPPEIEYADFAKVQLKVGKVLACEKVPKIDKLLKLTVDLGEGEPRTIVSGIAEAYAAEAVIGRNVVVVANLKPRALKGIESHGMILTAGPGGKDLVLLDPGAMTPGADVT